MRSKAQAALWLAFALISVPAEASFWVKDPDQPAFTAVPPRMSDSGQGRVLLLLNETCCLLQILCRCSSPYVAGRFTELQQLAQGETFINKLLGTDCFTKSLSIVNKDCSRLDSERKSRLAMALAICHLGQLGLPAFTCKPSMSLKQCADNMKDDRQYSTYMEFLSNIDT